MNAGHESEYDVLEQNIGYVFTDRSFLQRALTHSSYANERNRPGDRQRLGGGCPHNENLEFLGDAILGFTVAEEMYIRLPDVTEGKLSQRRAAVICEPSLADCAGRLGLGDLLKLGNNMTGEAGRRQDSILSDAMEAVFAAVYLDGGFDAARGVIKRCLGEAISSALEQTVTFDYKSRLQEHFFASDKNVKIAYEVISETGPPHRRYYSSRVAVNGRVLGEGSGHTKKGSEQNAAKAAFENIRL